jgi:hypothetical protein
MEARNSHFAAFIDLFTENTYMMVIMSDPTIRTFCTRPALSQGLSPILTLAHRAHSTRIDGDAAQHQEREQAL